MRFGHDQRGALPALVARLLAFCGSSRWRVSRSMSATCSPTLSTCWNGRSVRQVLRSRSPRVCRWSRPTQASLNSRSSISPSTHAMPCRTAVRSQSSPRSWTWRKPRIGERALCRDQRERHRRRHGRSHDPSCDRSVLHDQARRQGDRIGSLDGPRFRGPVGRSPTAVQYSRRRHGGSPSSCRLLWIKLHWRRPPSAACQRPRRIFSWSMTTFRSAAPSRKCCATQGTASPSGIGGQGACDRFGDGNQFDIVVTDYLHARAQRRSTDRGTGPPGAVLPILMITGHDSLTGDVPDHVPRLMKPFRASELLAKYADFWTAGGRSLGREAPGSAAPTVGMRA